MKITDSKHRLRELLNETKDSQNEMSRKTGLTKSAISNYINGTREPRQDAIYKISEAYNVNPAWLMGLDVKKELSSNKQKDMFIGDSLEIETFSQKEQQKKALEFYEAYEKADPNIKAAISSLLKGVQWAAPFHHLLLKITRRILLC